MNNLIKKEDFKLLIAKIDAPHLSEVDFLYEVYEQVFNGIEEISKENQLFGNITINSIDLIYYLIGEFVYSTRGFDEAAIKRFEENDSIGEMMCNVIADKYLSLSLYNHHEGQRRKRTNRCNHGEFKIQSA